MIEFNLFGIPIRVEPSFWFIMALFGFINFGIETSTSMISICLLMIAAFISILVHELGHGLMIKKYKLPTQIVLASFGGYATHPAGVLDRKQNFLVTLAGPLIQIILGLIVYIAKPYLGIPENSLFLIFISLLVNISIFWALINCLPVLPLDGGRMLDAAMGPKRQKTTIMIGMVIAALVAIFAITNSFIFGAVFMGMFFYQNLQAYKQLP